MNTRSKSSPGLESERLQSIPFVDVRENVAASVSIATQYLREQNLEPTEKLATAILYALRSETRGSEFQHSPLDRSVVTWVTPFADLSLLADIENAPLAWEYYSDLVLELQGTVVYVDAAICILPQAQGAEIVGEVADLLIRCCGVRRVFCAAVVDSDLYMSVRTGRQSPENAASLLQATIGELGGCGGHDHRAGGRIPDVASESVTVEALHVQLRQRWRQVCRADQHRGKRLVVKRDSTTNI